MKQRSAHPTGSMVRLLIFLAPWVLLAGCAPVAVTTFGVGAGAGVSHTLGGMVYKTFTEPLPKVKKALLVALDRMGIEVTSTEKTELGLRINSKAADRIIEVELEAITPKATRIRAIAKKDSIIMDSATATEIILQTDKVLGGA